METRWVRHWSIKKITILRIAKSSSATKALCLVPTRRKTCQLSFRIRSIYFHIPALTRPSKAKTEKCRKSLAPITHRFVHPLGKRLFLTRCWRTPSAHLMTRPTNLRPTPRISDKPGSSITIQIDRLVILSRNLSKGWVFVNSAKPYWSGLTSTHFLLLASWAKTVSKFWAQMMAEQLSCGISFRPDSPWKTLTKLKSSRELCSRWNRYLYAWSWSKIWSKNRWLNTSQIL